MIRKRLVVIYTVVSNNLKDPQTMIINQLTVPLTMIDNPFAAETVVGNKTTIRARVDADALSNNTEHEHADITECIANN